LANQTTTNFASDTLASNLGITVNLSDNNYTWFYETYDWPGNYNFTANRTLIIDTIRPLISFNSSLTYSTLVNVSRNNIPIGIDYTETNFANLTFNLYNATYNGIGFVNLTLVNSTLITDSTKFINFTNLADNYYFYNATIVDRANNKNSTETRLILLDTTNPNGTLISPLNNSYLAYLNVNLTANVSDNLGLANATLYVYNSSGGLFNSTIIIFAQGTTQTTIGVVVSFIEGIYTWFYQLFDWASNPFTTNNNTVIVDTIAPSMINIVYSPDTNNSIDPGTFMQFNVTVRDTTSGVNAVVLQVYNGSVWSNSSMSRISGTIYDGTWIANITTSLAETNYGFKIYSNDTSNNSVTSSRYNFSNYWDCTWNATTSLDAKAGYSETKNLGQITITNLGDSNYSEQCLLAFVTEHNLESGKMTLNSNNKRTTYTLTAGQTKNINVSYRFDLDPRSDSYIITHTESLVQNPSQINTTGTAVTSQAGPYLYQTISSYPSIVYIRPQTLSITSYISNLMGSSTYNETNTAFNVSSNWTISSQFTNLTGNFSNFFGNISDSDSHSLDLGLNATNWKTLPQGIYTLTLFSSGVDYNGTYIRDTNNNSNFTDSKNITVLCYPFADGFDASSCWPTDPDTVYCGNGKIDTTFGSNETCDDGNAISGDGCSLYCLVESGYSCSGVPSTCSAIGTGGTGGTGSSGGGGGGSSSNQKIEKSEATFELVRGEKQEFEFEIKNKYSGEMKNTKISVSGLNSQYIKLYPTEISSIKAGESAKIKVTISAPAYFTGKTYTLVFDISSIVNIDNKTYSLLDRKSVNLYLLEVPRKEANTMVNESERFVQEMKESGMILNQVQEILDNMKALYSNISFTELKKDFEALKQIYEDAFNSKALIEELKANIAQKTKEGVSTLETQGILFLGEAAYARGDYALSIKTLEDAKRAYATEVKGEFNILYAIKNNPMQSLGILLGASVFGIGSSLVIRYRLYKKRLKILGEEEILLLELMKVVQKECFENNKMSMEEYENAMMQYEHKLSETISDKIRTETKIANMFRISGKRLALEDEKKRLVSMIKKIQDDYLNKGKLETRIYENALNSYTARLGDVEEQMAFLDAQDALKKQTKIKRMFKV
jgi:cysteine-rich repeat protein